VPKINVCFPFFCVERFSLSGQRLDKISRNRETMVFMNEFPGYEAKDSDEEEV
jgi:hypothetical protein